MGQGVCVAALSAPLGPALSAFRDAPGPHMQRPSDKAHPHLQPAPHSVTTNGVKPQWHYRGTEGTGAQQEQEQNQHSKWLFPQNQGRRLKKTPKQPNLNGKDLTESFLIFMKLNAEAFTMS